jgi:hypothetical protein
VISEFEYIHLRLDGIKRKIKLPYIQNTYEKLENQEPKWTAKLKKDGYIIRRKKGIYYKLLKIRRVSMQSKVQIIEKVLNIIYKDSLTLGEWLEHRFQETTIKGNNEYIDCEYSYILDNIAMFFMSNGDKLPILSINNLQRIKMFEKLPYCEEISEIYEKTKWFELSKLSPEKLDNFEQKNKRQVKRWKNSKTYKLNKITSNYSSYRAEWRYLNNDGIFTFGDEKFLLDDVPEYKVHSDNKSDMDYVLCIKDDYGEINFYDMNIENIDKKHIRVI